MLIKAWSLTTNQKPEKTDKSLIIKIKPIKYQRYSLDYDCITSYKSKWYLTKHMKNNSCMFFFFSFFGGEEEFEIWPSFVNLYSLSSFTQSMINYINTSFTGTCRINSSWKKWSHRWINVYNYILECQVWHMYWSKYIMSCSVYC